MKFDKLNIVAHGYEEVEIPPMIRVRQLFDDTEIENPGAEIRKRLVEQYHAGKLREIEGKRIAITAGSRGIANYKEMLRDLVACLKELGATPFVFPAMGSHGGGTAEGQRQLLADFGLTEEYLECQILSSMDAVVIGQDNQGCDIYCDRYAAEADGIVVFHKVKPHPNFKGSHEGGLAKMICIGVGKHYGAASFHERGFNDFDQHLVEVADIFLQKKNVVFAVGVCENAYDRIARVEVIPTEQIIGMDAEMLAWSKTKMAKIYLNEIDVLVVDQFGKNICGTGIDGNIIGRNRENPQSEDEFRKMAPAIKRIVLLDLTDQTHGCAATMGIADFISYRFANKIDFESTYINLYTSKVPLAAAMPCYTNSDEQAIRLAILTGVHTSKKNARIVRIRNTLELAEIVASTAFIDEIAANPQLEVIEDPYRLVFNQEGNLW